MRFLSLRRTKFALWLVFMLMLGQGKLSAQTGIRTVGDEDNDSYNHAVSFDDGSFTILGTTYIPNLQTQDVSLTHYNAEGQLQWVRTYGQGKDAETGVVLLKNAFGGYVIIANSQDTMSKVTSAQVIITDANGLPFREALIGNGTEGMSVASATNTLDGGVIIVGSSGTKTVITKISALASIDWTKINPSETTLFKPAKVLATANNEYLIAGEYTETGNPPVAAVLKANANGNLVSRTKFINGGLRILDLMAVNNGYWFTNGISTYWSTDSDLNPLWVKDMPDFNQLNFGVSVGNQNYVFNGGSRFLSQLDEEGNSGTGYAYRNSVSFNQVIRGGEGLIVIGSATGVCNTNDGLLLQTDLTGNAGCLTNQTTFPSFTPQDSVTSEAFALSLDDLTTLTVTEQASEKFLTVHTERNLCETCDGSPKVKVNVLPSATKCAGSSDGTLQISTLACNTVAQYSINGEAYRNYEPLRMGLPAGNHVLRWKYTDNCEDSLRFNIVSPLPLSYTLNATDASQGNSDGMILIVDVAGGTAPYQYSLDSLNFSNTPAFMNLAPGTYCVWVRDLNDCMMKQCVEVKEQGACTLDLQIQTVDVTCPGTGQLGSMFIFVTDGQQPITYNVNTVNYDTPNIGNLEAGQYDLIITDARGCRKDTTVFIFQIGDSLKIASMNSTLPSCGQANGSIEVVASGGSAPLTYNIGPGTDNLTGIFPDLASASYVVTVTDVNGCSISERVELFATGEHTLTLSTTDLTCNGNNSGTITVTPSGGNAPFKYQLLDVTGVQTDSTFPGLAAGIYTVVCYDVNNCSVVQQVTVNEPDPIETQALVTPPVCSANNNGRVEILVSIGGQAPFEYSVNGSDFSAQTIYTNLPASEFITIITRDALGCTATQRLLFNGTNILKIDTVLVVDASCTSDDGQIAIVASGSSGYEYSINGAGGPWSATAVFPALGAGSYPVAVKDVNGCIITRDVEIKRTGGFSLNVTILVAPCAGQCNGVIRATVSPEAQQPVTYQLNGINPNETGTYSGLCAGEYVLSATDNSGCRISQVVTLTAAPKITFDVTQTPPNPANSNTGVIQFRNVTGGVPPYTYRIRGAQNSSSPNPTFNNLPCGDYQVFVTDASNCVSDTTRFNFPCQVGDFQVLTNSTPPTCFGKTDGSIAVTISNGTAPFHYSVNGGTEHIRNNTSFVISDLACGDYAINVRDNAGNSQLVNVTVDCPAELAFELTNTNPTCASSNDGSIIFRNESGGSGMFEYSKDQLNWDATGTFSNLTAGSYTVCMRDMMNPTCFTCDTVELTATAGLTITSIDVIMPQCDSTNGAIAIIAEGNNLEFALLPGDYQDDNVFMNRAAGLYVVSVRQKGTECTAQDNVLLFNKTELDLSAEVVAPSCNAGNDATVSIMAAGGLEPYEYSDNGLTYNNINNFPNLAPGSYVFYVKDGSGCSDTINVIVGGANAPSLTAESTQPACATSADGTVTLTATGGTAPYTYSKDDNIYGEIGIFGGLPAGSYTFYVKDNSGCKGQLSVELTAIGGVKIDSLTIIDASCEGNNGAVTVHASNGTGNYRYFLGISAQDNDSTFRNLVPQDYRVSVLDLTNGCFDTRDFTVGTRPDLDITFEVFPPSCFKPECGGFRVITNGGFAPYTYSTDGLTFGNTADYTCVPPGKTYNVYVKDARGCMDTASVFVPALTPVTFTYEITSLPGCGNPTGGTIQVTASGGSGNYFYELSSNPTDLDGTIEGVRAGTYQLFVRDFNNCSSDTVEVDVRALDSVKVDTIEVVQPNCRETNGFININIEPNSGLDIEYSIDGENWQPANSFGGLGEGTYNVQIRNSDGCVTTQTVELKAVGNYTVDFVVTNAKCAGSEDGELFIVGVTGGFAPYRYALDEGAFQDTNVFTGLKAGMYMLHIQDSTGCPYSQSVEVFEPTDIVVQTEKVLPTCWGRPTGSIIVTATGGTPPYRYALNSEENFQDFNVFDNLVASDYKVYVLDGNGCQTIYLDTLGVEGNKPPITVSEVIISPPRCEGVPNGRARILVSGGVAPILYRLNGSGEFQLNPTFLNLAAGEYFAEVMDADSCGLKDTFRFTVGTRFPNLIKDIIVNRPNCNNTVKASIRVIADNTFDQAMYSLDGGTPQASNEFTNVDNGTHSITVVFGNGCTATREVEVAPNSDVTIEEIMTEAPKCNGGKEGRIHIKAKSDDNNLTYSIDGENFQPAPEFKVPAGTYTVTVRSKTGCLATREVTITDPSGITVSEPLVSQPSCNDAFDGSIRVSAVGGTAPIRYILDGNKPNETGIFTELVKGIYIITAMDANGCKAAIEVRLNPPAGPAFAVTKTDASGPDKTDGIIAIKVTDGTPPYRYSVDAGSGFFGDQNVFNNLAVGFYTVIVEDAKGCRSQKVVQIGIRQAEVCSVPNEITVRDVTLTTAMVTWLPVTGAVRYEVRYRIRVNPGDVQLEWKLLPTNVTTATLTGLRTNFIYEVQVRTICGSSASPFSSSVSLNTSAGCDIPQITELTARPNSIIVTWASIPLANTYTVSYRKSGGSGWKDITVQSLTTSIEITELVRQTRYAIRIRANCATVQSPWSFTYTMATQPREGMNELAENLSVYPNPTRGEFNVQFSAEEMTNVRLELVDVSGRVLMDSRHQALPGSNNIPVMLNDVSAGVYMLRCTVGEEVRVLRLMVE